MYSLVIGFHSYTPDAARGLVGQVGLEPTTAKSTRFTVWGDTNYTVLTHIINVPYSSKVLIATRSGSLVHKKGLSPPWGYVAVFPTIFGQICFAIQQVLLRILYSVSVCAYRKDYLLVSYHPASSSWWTISESN